MRQEKYLPYAGAHRRKGTALTVQPAWPQAGNRFLSDGRSQSSNALARRGRRTVYQRTPLSHSERTEVPAVRKAFLEEPTGQLLRARGQQFPRSMGFTVGSLHRHSGAQGHPAHGRIVREEHHKHFFRAAHPGAGKKPFHEHGSDLLTTLVRPYRKRHFTCFGAANEFGQSDNLRLSVKRTQNRVSGEVQPVHVAGNGFIGKRTAEALAPVVWRKGEIEVSDGLPLEYCQWPDNHRINLPWQIPLAHHLCHT